MTKDTDEEIHSTGPSSVLSARASVPMEVCCITPRPARSKGLYSPTWKLSEAHAVGISWRLSLTGMTYYESRPQPLSLDEMGVQLKVSTF